MRKMLVVGVRAGMSVAEVEIRALHRQLCKVLTAGPVQWCTRPLGHTVKENRR